MKNEINDLINHDLSILGFDVYNKYMHHYKEGVMSLNEFLEFLFKRIEDTNKNIQQYKQEAV